MNDRALLECMACGTWRHATLLAAVLPRGASEEVVVAAAVEGLLSEGAVPDGAVLREAGLAGGGRCDIAVRVGADTRYFEWKLLWPGGVGEFARQAAYDRERLRRAGCCGYIVAFAYALDETPPEGEQWRQPADLRSLVVEGGKRAGLAAEPHVFDEFPISDYGCRGRGLVAAWDLRA